MDATFVRKVMSTFECSVFSQGFVRSGHLKHQHHTGRKPSSALSARDALFNQGTWKVTRGSTPERSPLSDREALFDLGI